MPIMNSFYNIFQNKNNKNNFEINLEKGDFIEFLLYDYFESLGYNTSLCKNKQGKQTVRVLNVDCVIPDILVEGYPKALFFLESKSSWYNGETGIKIPKRRFLQYESFNNFFPQSFKERLGIGDSDTKIAFTKVEPIEMDFAKITHYIDTLSSVSWYKDEDGQDYFWSFNTLQEQSENFSYIVELKLSFDGTWIKTPYCENIYAKERYTWFYSESELKNLAAGKRKNAGDGW